MDSETRETVINLLLALIVLVGGCWAMFAAIDALGGDGWL